ncbi:uncharacterized protein CEXT_521061 [Caerostris extrusa]|uniref:Uncharacterized protein n=1 Tax=Caerostris extrusa TaxID=172846 RepID=A0AAV4SPJ7_CAEEX|nr:uncharacterized protein CEXT_521061 [Caerostris extrusa]
MSQDILSDDSDEDLPSLPFENLLKITNKKKEITFDELYEDNLELHNERKKEQKRKVRDESTAAEATTVSIPFMMTFEKELPKIKELFYDEEEEFTAENLCVYLLGEFDYLQFFAPNDLTFQKFRFDSLLEKKLKEFLDIGKIIIDMKGLEYFSFEINQLKLILLYIFKTMSVHPNLNYVRNCQTRLSEILLIKQSDFKKVSISSMDVFMVLFNYGVNVKKEIFNIIPNSKEVQQKYSDREQENKMPKNWIFNLKAALKSLCNILDICTVENKDLCEIFVYLLWMSIDHLLKNNIRTDLQRCLTTVLHKFSKEDWSIYRLRIAQLMMLGDFSSNEMFIDGTLNFNTLPEFSDELFHFSKLLLFLESLRDIDKSVQFTAIKFIEILINNLQLQSQKQFYKLSHTLRWCETHLEK